MTVSLPTKSMSLSFGRDKWSCSKTINHFFSVSLFLYNGHCNIFPDFQNHKIPFCLMTYCSDHIQFYSFIFFFGGGGDKSNNKSIYESECIWLHCISNCCPKVHWRQWTDIDSLEVYNWSPSLCQQVEIVAEQAINQKTELMKGEINKTQTNKTCISEFPAWLLLIWLSCLHVASSVHYVKLSGSHTSATKPKENNIYKKCVLSKL